MLDVRPGTRIPSREKITGFVSPESAENRISKVSETFSRLPSTGTTISATTRPTPCFDKESAKASSTSGGTLNLLTGVSPSRIFQWIASTSAPCATLKAFIADLTWTDVRSRELPAVSSEIWSMIATKLSLFMTITLPLSSTISQTNSSAIIGKKYCLITASRI